MPLIGTRGGASSRGFGRFGGGLTIPSGTVLSFINSTGSTTAGTRGISDASGQSGPTQAQANAAYTGVYLNNVTILGAGLQKWTVPATFTGTINAVGGNGGLNNSANASGAWLQHSFQFNAGDVIIIGVGQGGSNSVGAAHCPTAGGGATGIAISRNPGGDASSYVVNAWGGNYYPLIIAAGGAGAEAHAAGIQPTNSRVPGSTWPGDIYGTGASWSSQNNPENNNGAGYAFTDGTYGGKGGTATAAYSSGYNNYGGFGICGGGAGNQHYGSGGGGGFIGGVGRTADGTTQCWSGSSYLYTGEGQGWIGTNPNSSASVDGYLTITVT